MKKEVKQVKLLEENRLYICGNLQTPTTLLVKLDEHILLEKQIQKSNLNFSFLLENLTSGKTLRIYKVIEKEPQLLYEKDYIKLEKSFKMDKKISYLKRNIGFLWREYHFLIPPKKFMEYTKLFVNRIIFNKRKEDMYYQIFSIEDYNDWLKENEIKTFKKEKFSYEPKISVLVPVYNVDSIYLEEAIKSVIEQTYQNFEICIADDASTREDTKNLLKELEQKYPQVKVVYRKKNGHISEASNTALELATGEFIALLDNDDVLDKNALYEVVKKLNEDSKLDLIYSDEDKLSPTNRRCDPHFKPDFSKDTLLSHNYICHLCVLRTSLVKEIGGFRKGYEGSQDYDLMLRVTEKTEKIAHIPKILYHWRMIEGSTSMTTDNKGYATTSGVKALQDTLKRRKIEADIDAIYTSYILKYKVKNNPLVSIIIPTKDKIELVNTCVNSIFQKTKYKHYEIIIIDNNSIEEKTIKALQELEKKHKNLKVIRDKGEFNYSRINNLGVAHAKGEYILLLNNDIEIINEDWLEEMLGYAFQEHIGAVGPKLLFKNNKIQHAGVVVGVGEEKIANHAYYLKDKFAPALAGRLMVPYNYSAVTGACLLVSKKKYLEVEGLTEQLKVNYNDIDFCLKLLEKGYFNVFLPQVEIYHYESLSRGKKLDEKKAEELKQATEYMKKRWKKILQQDPFYNPLLSKEMCFVLDKKKKGEE